MNSVAHHRGIGKRIVAKRERTYKMVQGDLGTQVRREPIHIWRGKEHAPPTRKRGDIQGFSDNSRSRLRVLLSTAQWSGGEHVRVGLTLTLPWAADADEWRKVWHRFMHRIVKRFDRVGMIWRIELTTGTAERSGGVRRCHVHSMCWLPIDAPLLRDWALVWRRLPAAERSWLNVQEVARAWIKNWEGFGVALDDRQVLYATSIGEGKGFGVSLKWLDNSTDGAIHYLCDHATKHKDEQLGWRGRQWGVINRHCFRWADDGETVSGHEWAVASRQLRRYSRKLRLTGSKRAQPFGDNKCFFGASETALKRVVKAAKEGVIS